MAKARSGHVAYTLGVGWLIVCVAMHAAPQHAPAMMTACMTLLLLYKHARFDNPSCITGVRCVRQHYSQLSALPCALAVASILLGA